MNKLDYKNTLIVGLGFLGVSVVWPIFNFFIPVILQAGNPEYQTGLTIAGFALGPAITTFIMTWDNILNVFIQPWAGAKSDRTWNRFGRRKPWLLVGMPIAIVGFVLVPFANTILAIMVFILITNFGMAIFRSPTVAWLGDLFTPEKRSTANGIMNLLGGVGAALALFGGGILFDRVGIVGPFVGGAILVAVVVTVAVINIKEPEKIELEEEDTGAGVLENLRAVWHTNERSGFFVLLSILLWFIAFEALQTGLSSFAIFTLGLDLAEATIYPVLFAGAFILFALPSGLIGTRFGRRQTITAGLIGLVILLTLGYVVIRDKIGFGIILGLSGICWALININGLPLVYDYGNEKQIGAYTGLYYFSSQSAAILGPVLSGLTIEILDKQWRWMWIFSAVFMALAWLVMTRVKDKTTVTQPVVAD